MSRVRDYFKAIEGKRPFRARLGVGSFITLDFGRPRLKDGHFVGEYFLWIYMCDWKVLGGFRELADSERGRTFLKSFVRTFEQRTLEQIEIKRQGPEYKTLFHFSGGVDLVCTPYRDEGYDEDDPCWYLFAADGVVVESYPDKEMLSPAKDAEPAVVNS